MGSEATTITLSQQFEQRLQETAGRPSTVDVSLFFDKSGSKVTSLDAPLLEGPAARRRVLIQILTAVPRREYEGISLQAGAILVEPTVFDALKRLEHIHFEWEGGNRGVVARLVNWYTYKHMGDEGYDVRVVATTQTICDPTQEQEDDETRGPALI